ncbi:hypothetical protein ZWY2020_058681 [Hordeum vulgare]|nr:hypothetical protein ZWY2020_058681 [Hordeum vulgare]
MQKYNSNRNLRKNVHFTF